MNSIGQVGLTFILTALGLALIGAIFTGKITVSVDGVQIGDRGILDLSAAEFPVTVSSTLDADQVSVGIGVSACANNEVWKGNGSGKMECGTVAGGGGSSAFSVREDTVQATSAASGIDFRPGFDVHHTDGNDTILTVDVSEFSTTEATLESILTDASDVFTDNDTDFIDEDDLATSDWGHVRIFGGFAIVEDVTTSAIGQITDIGSGIRSGADGDLITGTAGGNGTCAEWNTDGDLVEAASGAACGSGGGGGSVSGSWWFIDTATGTTPVPDTASDTLAILSPSSTIQITGDASGDSVGFDIHIQENGSDGDSSTTLNDSGLEFIGGALSLMRGCSDLQGLEWSEGADQWGCANAAAFRNIGVDTGTAPVADTSSDTLTFTSASTDIVVNGNSTTDTVDLSVSDTLDLSAHTSFAIPAGASEVVNADGEIAHDTDADQLIIGADADVIPTTMQYGFVILDAEVSTEILPAWNSYGATVLEINCIVDPFDDAGDTAVIYLEERDSTGDNPAGLDGTTTITCDGDGASDDGTLSNPTIDLDDYWSIVVTSTSGTVDNLTINGTYSVTRSGGLILVLILAGLFAWRRYGTRR